jgi:hypothetical protein
MGERKDPGRLAFATALRAWRSVNPIHRLLPVECVECCGLGVIR